MRRATLHAAALALVLLAARTDAASACEVFRITGYASSDYPGRTATGEPTIGNEWRIAAVDPAVIPLGSRLWVEGIGELRAADTGPGVRGRHLDVLVETRAQAFALTGERVVCRI